MVIVVVQVVGGCDNVVAIVPKGAKLDTVTESTDAVIIRAQDAAGALELRKRLTASANQMAAVAGLLDVSLSLHSCSCPAVKQPRCSFHKPAALCSNRAGASR